MIDFSIIIPAKNEEINIAQCLDSINTILYDRNRFEVLVVDNGSTDRTVDVAKERGAKVYVQPDLTISGLRNFGARQATGKVLAFLDADCTVSKNWLNAAAFYSAQEDVVAFGSPVVLPEVTTWVQRTWFFIRRKSFQVEEVDWHESANLFVRRDSFESVNGFDENLVTCEDYDLSLRLKKLGRLLADDRVLAIHHREPATIRDFFNKERWRSFSNRERLVSVNFKLRELPSLVLPLVHCLLAFVFIVFFVLIWIVDGSNINKTWLLLLLVWQLPLLSLAFWKIRRELGFVTAVQLYALLNVYFFARGLAWLRRS